MSERSFSCCVCTAIDFSLRHGTLVTTEIFKEVLIATLAKLARIVKQIEYDPDEYIPLLFADCLREHYMFAKTSSGVKITKEQE